MGTLATGITFIPISTSNEQWRLTVLHRTLEALGGVQKIKEAVVAYERTAHLPLEQRCERVALGPGYSSSYLVFDLAGFKTTFQFSRPNSPLPVPYVTLEIPRGSFASDLVGDPMRVEVFAAEWVRLCEMQGAELAYFSEGFSTIEEERLQTFFAALQENNLSTIANSNWRTYLSPSLMDRWQEQLKQPGRYRMERLPSGAAVCSSGRGYNPVMGDANSETFLQAEFLSTQIQRHPEIEGAQKLLRLIEQEVEKLHAIEAQDIEDIEDDELYHERFHENMQVEDLARARMFQIRATWTYALQSSGLVGVVQDVQGEDGETIEVPVIEDEGRTWIYPTLLYPFEVQDEEWSDPHEGLEIQVFTLLNAAQQNIISGEPPRVVVFFWRGVTQEVREQLEAMGARVEVSPNPIPLLG